jgi:hypothetical protein
MSDDLDKAKEEQRFIMALISDVMIANHVKIPEGIGAMLALIANLCNGRGLPFENFEKMMLHLLQSSKEQWGNFEQEDKT